MDDVTTYRVTEARHTPPEGLALGIAAMLPMAAGAIAVLLAGPAQRSVLLRLTILWGAAILAFLAGVRRGLSFRTEGGATLAEIASMLLLFALAFLALALPGRSAALLLLLAGFACIAVFDPRAARRGEAPPFFARLRPPQMLVPLASLAVMLVRLWAAGP